MKQENVDVIYTMENINTVCLLKKQSYQMGWSVPVVMSGAILDLDTMKGICGSAEAMEGICGDYSGGVWDLKKTKISPYYLDFVQKLKVAWKAKTGKELTNTGIISTGVQMICQYVEAVKKAGSKDPDMVMKSIKGGTFDTVLGTYTFSGHTVYDADVVCGYPTAVSIIKNGKITYLTEYPIANIDTDVPITSRQ
jgi:ABC-type branched-subunit amino acid transport system substrate-binding protein